ncbi:MAG: hypothetical protein QM757_22600 [Paludibaculum sp.]
MRHISAPYLRQLARMLRDGFDSTTMQARIQSSADLIRPDVYSDPNKFYSNTDFEDALCGESVSTGQTTVLGLTDFVTRRAAYLRPVLDTYAPSRRPAYQRGHVREYRHRQGRNRQLQAMGRDARHAARDGRSRRTLPQ